MNNQRIDGEFHYAILDQDSRILYARHGEVKYLPLHDDLMNPDSFEDIAHAKLARFDAEARHFIDQGRKQALEEVDAAAEKLASVPHRLKVTDSLSASKDPGLENGPWFVEGNRGPFGFAATFTEALFTATVQEGAEGNG